MFTVIPSDDIVDCLLGSFALNNTLKNIPTTTGCATRLAVLHYSRLHKIQSWLQTTTDTLIIKNGNKCLVNRKCKLFVV